MKIAEKIAEEAIDELMMAGIAFLLVVTGINYFNMEWAWTSLIGKTGAAAGIASSAAATEFSTMITALTNVFPFKYLFVQYNFWGALVLAVVLTAIGVALKAFTVKTKGKFIIDLGSNIYMPAIFSFISIIALQVWSSLRIDEYLTTHKLARPEFSSGYFIWQTYGQLFLIGASLLVIGAIVKLIAEKNKYRKLLVVGDTMFNGAFVLIIYYLIIRILALEFMLNAEVGKILGVFILSNQYSNFTLLACVFLFTGGVAIKNYGIAVLKHEKNEMHAAAAQYQREHMQREYGAHPIGTEKYEEPHLKVTPYHLRHPAYSDPHHPVHRYVHPDAHYKRKRE